PIRTVSIKIRHNSCWRECREKRIPVPFWWGSTLVQPLWRTVWMSPNKLKINRPYNPVIPLLGIYPEKRKTSIWKDICTVYLLQCYLQQTTYENVHTHTHEYYTTMRKDEIVPFVTTWMDLEGIMLSEISQTEKDK
ncbi:LORF2 protein, partial [Crocuta crocuta]